MVWTAQAACAGIACVCPNPAPFWCGSHTQEPTGAETQPGMEALVVSQETLPGGEAINQGRARRGFAPLALVVVGLVGGDGGVAAKLSSTALRERDAQALAQQEQQLEQAHEAAEQQQERLAG